MATDITALREGIVFFELELSLPDKSRVSLSPQLSFEMALVEETVHGIGSANIGLRATSTDFFDTTLKNLNSSGTPLLRFRYGVGASSLVQWIPWQLHILVGAEGRVEGTGPAAGHTLRLITRDILHLIDRSSRVNAHRGTISRIVSSIASRNGIKDTVIEDTQGDGLWIQSYAGDAEFIRKRLVARARNKGGHGSYYFYARDNVLHFHTLNYQTSVNDLSYYSAPTSRLTQMDSTQMRLRQGASGVRLVSHDPYTGLNQEIRNDPDKAVRLGNSIPRIDRVLGGDRNILLHASGNRPEELSNVAQNAYEAARNECFQLKLEMKKTAPLRAGDLLRINLDPTNARTSSWSGTYLVASASHKLDHGDINSVYVLQRGEQVSPKGVPNSITRVSQSVVIDDQNAPGVDVSLAQAQASALTRGSGKAVSSKVYLTVQDKNTAPIAPSSPSLPDPNP